MKNTSKALIAFAVASFLASGFAFAAAKDSKPESKIAGCCAKAQSANKDCSHACCVAAAKDGNNCGKCGGSGPLAKTAKK